MQDTLEFTLEKPLKVHGQVDGKNEFIEIDKLYLKAPTYKHKDKTIALKKDFIEALFGMTNSVDKEEAQDIVNNASDSEKDDVLEAKAILAILYASKGFDIGKFFNKFINFLTSKKDGICFKDEDYSEIIRINEIEELSESDLENLIAKYTEVFFAVSWMKTLK
jgi:hypothetical protein